MNNLHRDLAPISADAWTQIDDQVAHSFTSNAAARRVVDLVQSDRATAAVPTGHLRPLAPPAPGVRARQRLAVPVVELRVEFSLDRESIDDVERGGQDGDWQQAADAALALARAEDRAILDGLPAAGILGVRKSAGGHTVRLPNEVSRYPEAVARALSMLRTAGVDGPYSLLLGEQDYIAVRDSTEQGYLIDAHLRRLLGGDLVWAPAVTAPMVLTTRGGDFVLHLVQDVSVGYAGHNDTDVRLYLQEAFTFLDLTSEAAVVLSTTA